jgi:VWA domain-containing protein
MKSLLILAAIAIAGSPAAATEDAKARVDVVFCIDRSGSMQGVIETAKQKVWSIINEIAKTKPTPVLRIGLIGYGSADHDIKLFPLSEDLDKVYGDLLTFKVDMGGDEWVGWAIQQATQKMDWSKEKGALKIIFMVGNETAMQGSEAVLYPKTVPETIKRDITVNAIYAGKPNVEEERTWREVAKLADGMYTQIDLSGGAITIETPMDQKLMELNTKLNGTYIPFGKKGEAGQQAQVLQDSNSLKNGGSSNGASRAMAKCWSGYNCAQWDLVDAAKAKDFKLEEIKKEDLPKELQELSLEEKKALIAKKSQERDGLQKEINTLGVERQKFMDVEIKKRNLTQDSAFDEAVRKTIREQAGRKGFTFEGSSK